MARCTVILLSILIAATAYALGRGRRPSGGHLTVCHLEVPHYPAIAHMVGRQGTVNVTVEINGSGEVIAAHGVGPSLLLKDVEANVRTWKFAHLPAGANFPISHTVQFEFRIEGPPPNVREWKVTPLPRGGATVQFEPKPKSEWAECTPPKISFELPDRVTVVAAPEPFEIFHATVKRRHRHR